MTFIPGFRETSRKGAFILRLCLVTGAAAMSLAACQSQPQSEVAVLRDVTDSVVAPGGPATGAAGAAAAVRSPRAMPDFVLQDLAGHTVKLSDYAGKAVLLNFWATWCPPCKAEMPDLVEIQSQFGGERFTVIGVSLDQTGMAGVRNFVNERGLNFPILMGNEHVVIQYGNFRGIPTTFLLNSDHELARKYSGLVTRKMVETDLSKIFDGQA